MDHGCSTLTLPLIRDLRGRPVTWPAPPTRARMKYQRGGRATTFYIQAVPGENLHAKPLGTKTWRKPGQIYVEIKEKRREEEKERRSEDQNAMVKKIKK